MSFYSAKRNFEENLNLFADPQTNPEKYNLYMGLLNMVRGIESLEREVDQVKEEVHRIRVSIK